MVKKDRFWIGFDLGGTKMMACLLNDDLEVIARERTASKGAEGSKAGMKRVMGAIDAVMRKADGPVEGIGIGCPAVVNLRKGILRHAPNLGWDEVPVGDLLAERFGIPAYVLNDVDAGAFGEYSHGAGQGAETLVAVFPGTGVGAGCVIGGQLLTGKNASCMEIGNMHLAGFHLLGNNQDPPIMEDLCSRLAIASASIVEAYRGRAPNLLEDAGTDLKNIKSGAIARAIKAGDEAIADVVGNAVFVLGLAVANTVDLLGPDKVVLGGGLVEKLPEVFVSGVSKVVKQYSRQALADDVKVCEAKLGDDAGVIGAAAYSQARAARARTT